VIKDQEPPEKVHHRNSGSGENQFSKGRALIVIRHHNPRFSALSRSSGGTHSGIRVIDGYQDLDFAGAFDC